MVEGFILESNMTLQERVKAAQERLVARGVKDVKFTWNYEALKTNSRDQVFEDVAVALEAYLDGRCTPAQMYDRPAA